MDPAFECSRGVFLRSFVEEVTFVLTLCTKNAQKNNTIIYWPVALLRSCFILAIVSLPMTLSKTPLTEMLNEL